MKALPMLDHVMLWVVRISAPGLLCLSIYYFASQVIGDEISVESEAFSAQSLYLVSQILLFMGVVSVWCLRSGIVGLFARLFLAVFSAASFLFLALSSSSVGLFNFSLFQQVFIIWEFFGLISMFWIACRTPRDSRNNHAHVDSDTPLPQSS